MNQLFTVNDLHVTYKRPGEKPLEAERAGRRVTVNPARPVYLQVSDSGRVEACEEL